jgi:hypothetical protein
LDPLKKILERAHFTISFVTFKTWKVKRIIVKLGHWCFSSLLLGRKDRTYCYIQVIESFKMAAVALKTRILKITIIFLTFHRVTDKGLRFY